MAVSGIIFRSERFFLWPGVIVSRCMYMIRTYRYGKSCACVDSLFSGFPPRFAER